MSDSNYDGQIARAAATMIDDSLRSEEVSVLDMADRDGDFGVETRGGEFRDDHLASALDHCFHRSDMDALVDRCVEADTLAFQQLRNTQSLSKRKKLKILCCCRPAGCQSAADLFLWLVWDRKIVKKANLEHWRMSLALHRGFNAKEIAERVIARYQAGGSPGAPDRSDAYMQDDDEGIAEVLLSLRRQMDPPPVPQPAASGDGDAPEGGAQISVDEGTVSEGDSSDQDAAGTSAQAANRRRTFHPPAAVKILKAFFNERLPHPYPTLEQKEMLVQQTGLTLSNVVK